MDSTRIIEAASKKLCEKAETHVVFAIDKVTKAIKIFGDEKAVELMVEDGPVMKKINDILQQTRRHNESSEFKMYSKSRFHLFADIGSAQWTGVSRIRAQTSQILSLHGFGHKDSGNRFGEGDPPEGWPTPYVWERYGGPSTATIAMNTQILLGLAHYGREPVSDKQVTFHCIEFNLYHCLISISSIWINPELLQDEVGDHEDELPDDQVELNQDERKQDEMELIVLPEEVSTDNFALIVIWLF